ncbi:MAG: nitroreductase family protein [Cytophagales bacterium]|nr:nitroreductase family protein [Cytophagales bacterium]
MISKVKTIDGFPFVKHSSKTVDGATLVARSKTYYEKLDTRRSVRNFSSKPVPLSVIKNLIRTASTAPSGAHKQPWTFCVVKNKELKKEIRLAAEKEERESYDNRMSEEWLDAIKPLQTNWEKPFLETAPYLIIVFKKSYDLLPDGSKRNNYYVSESVGLACGFLLTAIHQAGLVALTHTPSPMNFLTTLLERPLNEKPFLLIPVGFAHSDAWVPKLKRKPLAEIMVEY